MQKELRLMNLHQGNLALNLLLSRLYPTGMLSKQEVCLPEGTSLIVFSPRGPLKATLIPPIP